MGLGSGTCPRELGSRGRSLGLCNDTQDRTQPFNINLQQRVREELEVKLCDDYI
jgi:hypothetical protein